MSLRKETIPITKKSSALGTVFFAILFLLVFAIGTRTNSGVDGSPLFNPNSAINRVIEELLPFFAYSYRHLFK